MKLTKGNLVIQVSDNQIISIMIFGGEYFLLWDFKIYDQIYKYEVMQLIKTRRCNIATCCHLLYHQFNCHQL